MVVYTVSILCEREQLLQLLIEQVSMFLASMFRTVSSLETQICGARMKQYIRRNSRMFAFKLAVLLHHCFANDVNTN